MCWKCHSGTLIKKQQSPGWHAELFLNVLQRRNNSGDKAAGQTALAYANAEL